MKAASLPLAETDLDPIGVQQLQDRLQPQISMIVRSVVDYTIARHNVITRRTRPISMSVLNRRRRAARSWLLAISHGRSDAVTRHAVTTQWLPFLCGTGPDLELIAGPARELIEFVRGAITACIFDEVAENLLPHARALYVLESSLAAHLAAVQQMAPQPSVATSSRR